MATTADYERAAQTAPDERSAAQIALVNTAHDQHMVNITNIDAKTRDDVKSGLRK